MNDSSTWSNTYPEVQPPADELIGLKLDERYVVEKELGHGGVGAVYLARDLKLHDKPVVVKVLLEKSLRDHWTVQKFLQEKEALARVDHPGVVGILDTGEIHNGQPYIVMQFVDGVSLRAAIREMPEGMNLERVASIVRQIGSALSAVHLKKIYHRDLKPENIMLQLLGRGAEQVKIVDFGIAKIKESVIAPSTITGAATAGTIVYMSPEQLYGSKVTGASDIYSFGVIAYEMVTGRRPFNPETIAHLSDMQRKGIPVKPRDLRPRLPVEAETKILKALSYDPKDRYENAADFGETLSSALLSEERTFDGPQLRTQLPSTLISVGSAADQPLDHPLPQGPQREFQDVPPLTPARSNARLKVAAGLMIAIGLILTTGLIVLLFSSGWRNILASDDRVDRTEQLPQRSLVYSLTVQKMRDRKPYQEPFQSSGQEIFESGYRFRFNVSSTQSGYLYLFNEGADDRTGGQIFTIIYPTPATNGGSARLDSNPSLQTNWNEFAGRPGTEHFWMTWSDSPIASLEAAKETAFKSVEGAITDASTIASLKQFLLQHSQSKSETVKDTANKQTSVTSEGDVLVKRLELEHR